MEVIVGKTAGFCFGVKRAIELSKATADTSKDAYCVGSIVHNKVVNDDLKSRGLNFVKSIEEVPVGSMVIIRAHGVTQEEMKLCEKRNLYVVDTTCPNVKKIHDIVNKHSKEGYKVIIIGDDGHPEVIGISGWTSGDYVVIDDIDSLNNVNLDKVCVVSQTTMNYETSRRLASLLRKMQKNVLFLILFVVRAKTVKTS